MVSFTKLRNDLKYGNLSNINKSTMSVLGSSSQVRVAHGCAATQSTAVGATGLHKKHLVVSCSLAEFLKRGNKKEAAVIGGTFSDILGSHLYANCAVCKGTELGENFECAECEKPMKVDMRFDFQVSSENQREKMSFYGQVLETLTFRTLKEFLLLKGSEQQAVLARLLNTPLILAVRRTDKIVIYDACEHHS